MKKIKFSGKETINAEPAQGNQAEDQETLTAIAQIKQQYKLEVQMEEARISRDSG